MTVPASRLSKAMISVRDWPFVLLTCVCIGLLFLAVVGPFLAPYSPQHTDILAAGQGPTAAHFLGTDSLGRDIFSRLLAGARVSFAAALAIVFVSTTFGTAFALGGAWYGGLFDSLLGKVLNVLFAIPGILIAVIAAAVFGAGFWAPVIALSIVYIPYVARVIRSAAIQERQRSYVEACQLAGVSAWKINTRHILRNIFPIVLAQSTFGFGSALIDFGAISFLGLGMQPPSTEWGLMVSEGRSELLEGSYQLSLSAGSMIVVTVIAFNMLGERITQRLGGSR